MYPQGSPSKSATTSEKEASPNSHAINNPDSHMPSSEQKTYERKLLLKLDFRIIPILYCILVLMLIDRSNIGNVKIEGMLPDLHMKGNDFNVAVLVYTIPMMLLELPSSLAVRTFRPAVWVSWIVFGWGVCTIGAGLTRSYGGLLACRVLVGCFEAGYLPCAAYLISQYYKRHEFQLRYSLFFSATQVGGAFGGFLAYALAKMDGVGGYGPWRWIFIMEGILTIILSILAFFFVVPLPENAKFLNRNQKTYLLDRLARDDREVGADADTTPLMFREVLKIATHWKVVLSLLIYFCADINAASINSFQPTILKATGYTSAQAQIHTILVYMVAMVTNLLFSILSDRLALRSPFLLAGALIGLIGWLLEFLAIPSINPKTGLGAPGMRYAGMFCIAIGAFVQFPILTVWLSNNLRGRKTRNVGLAVVIGGENCGNFVVANVFSAGDEKTGFKTGFATGVGLACLGIVVALALLAGYWWENRALERKEREEEESDESVDGWAVRFRNTL